MTAPHRRHPPAALSPSTTPAGTSELDSVSWALYRDVAVVDPMFVFDYPDNAAIALLCESLSKQQPDGSIVDGLATLTQPDATTLVYTMNPAATFWDGTTVTAADAAFSLKRQSDPNARRALRRCVRQRGEHHRHQPYRSDDHAQVP